SRCFPFSHAEAWGSRPCRRKRARTRLRVAMAIAVTGSLTRVPSVTPRRQGFPRWRSTGPRLHPGITQEVASNESLRGAKATREELIIYEALFVARWLQSGFRKGLYDPHSRRPPGI